MNALNPAWPGTEAPFEGSFAYAAPWYWKPPGGPPYPSIDAGEGAIVAGTMPGESGIAAGRFGWFNPATRLALNTRTTAQDQLGVVIPRGVNWEGSYWSRGSRWIRSGCPVTMMSAGAFWLRFPAGAFRGDQVYANVSDGSAASGAADGAELTKFMVTRGCAPGGLGQVSTWVTFGD